MDNIFYYASRVDALEKDIAMIKEAIEKQDTSLPEPFDKVHKEDLKGLKEELEEELAKIMK